jgi:hypothetical protein
MTNWSVATAVFAVAALIAVHARSAILCPSVFGTKEEYCNLNLSAASGSVQYIDLRISDLTPVHRFVELYFSLVSNSSTVASTRRIDVVVRTATWNDSSILFDAGERKHECVANFAPKRPISNSFLLVHQSVTDFDALRVKLAITTEYTEIQGFKFIWQFITPGADRHLNTSDMLLSVLIAYMFLVFVANLKFEDESFVQAFLIVVGLSGILASNPVRLLVRDREGPAIMITDHVLMALFTAVFRMFLIIELELLRGHYTKPASILVVILAILFGFYATLDATASYDRRMHIDQSETKVHLILSSEWALLWAHLAYHCAAGILGYHATKGGDGTNQRRVIYMAGCVLGTGISTLVTQGWCVLTNTCMYTLALPLFQHSMIATFAAMTLFLFRPARDKEYQNLAAADQGKGEATFDLDALADSEEPEEEDEESGG